jgi:TorA maturation chaperone TorD
METANMNADTVRNAEAETAAARARVYGLLAKVYRSEPDREFLARLRDPHNAQSLSEFGVSLEPDNQDRSLEELVEDLAVEYTQLFVGPGPHLSPHESVHTESGEVRDGELWGPQTVKVKAFIEATGLHYAEDFHEMPDHISAELEFMGKLSAEEAELWQTGDEENALGSLRIQRRFFDEHVNQWMPRFCQRIIDRNESEFYAKVAELTRAVLDYDDGVMRESLSQREN